MKLSVGLLPAVSACRCVPTTAYYIPCSSAAVTDGLFNSVMNEVSETFSSAVGHNDFSLSTSA